MKKKIDILLLTSCCFLKVFSQEYHIQGTILDNKMIPIEFATVALLSLPDSALIDGTISDSSGHFSLFTNEIDNNFLKISFVGYETKYLPTKSEQIIILQANSTLLDEVSIKVFRPKVTFKDDRFEVKIENSIAAKGNTIESLLQQLPGVWATSDGSILINGLSGVQIYINDRPVNLSGASLMKYLSSFRSEDINRIEVIQRPSAIYAAEGNGIIKIITKKNIDGGVSGTIGTKIDKQYFSGFTPFISFQYHKGDFGANISLNGEKTKWLLLTDNYAKDIQRNVDYKTQLKDTAENGGYPPTQNGDIRSLF
ncbi:carboxypeptidase-like regulatory domain-containing protein [Proteiniphilum sp. X52]|uniref:carboxypeptidase-like regulatory domain-containing protein n=1 Tax=Proteiniphilum sp. X52 TaxID=2382159 RepID=UPI000F0A66F8|nr:carboxypeptidase-like regulatory domain-containing protein [Proteiniphilum sp. X52]RNC63235.1 hypothetical protein D7D25_17620 [Proteiniphilum sp. X52]